MILCGPGWTAAPRGSAVGFSHKNKGLNEKIFGSTTGLSASQIRELENLYQFNTTPEDLISREQLDALIDISSKFDARSGFSLQETAKPSMSLPVNPTE